MIDIAFERLRTLGLTPALANRAHAVESAGPDNDNDNHINRKGERQQLLRLTEVHRETVRLHDGTNEFSARVLPRLIRTLADDETALAVGDWVLAAPDAHGQIWVSGRVPPLSHINRRDADGRRHPVVSNVDTAVLVMGLDDDFNVRRLERYLALVHASSASIEAEEADEGGRRPDIGAVMPVVVLTKSDVAARTPGLIASRIEALKGRLPAAIDLFLVDGTDPETAQRLGAYLGPGQTLVMLGSSGAGKSTLTNTLIGAKTQDTGAVREHDSRGKHTTTSRSLHLLPGGACVIDTPGLRALRPDADEATLATTFADIDSLSAHCRFRDCKHHDEPGCAVREAVAADRLRNYHKLLREARRDTMSILERRQQLAMWKARGREARVRIRAKRDGE
jgi:ribosome biogenesis GTPase